jgi:hypothetical protein
MFAKPFRIMRVLAGVALALAASGCATSREPPSDLANACSILEEKRGWEDDVFDAARTWSVSPGLILAFMKQESRFRHDARPRDGNGRLRSTALGYAQALDGTWADYVRARGGKASRKDFEASADFIGWYLDRIARQAGVARTDARALYLAYHEGPGGYARGTHRGKAWLGPVADRVAAQARTYDAQLSRCERRQMRRLTAAR